MKKVAEIVKATGNILLSVAALIGAMNYLIMIIVPEKNENEA